MRTKSVLSVVATGALLVACAGGGGDDGNHSGRAGSGSGSAGTSASDASCAGMNGTECQTGSCCTTLPVTGGTFEQGATDGFSSTVASFSLDKFEVTVGRFRNFVASYDAWHAAGNPVTGSGKNPNVPGSGWSADFDGSLPATSADLLSELHCGDPTFQTWASAGDDTLPINCVDWFTSFAFCIWDGGRLPTESEWEYAAARGASDTLYPWGDTPVPDNSPSTAYLASYDGLGNGDPDYAFSDILPVGSRPAGDGLYGQSDLAGSMWEWNLDWFAIYPTSAEIDYANLAATKVRVIRGGDWSSPADTLLAAARYSYGYPDGRFTNVGFRCAKDPR